MILCASFGYLYSVIYLCFTLKKHQVDVVHPFVIPGDGNTIISLSVDLVILGFPQNLESLGLAKISENCQRELVQEPQGLGQDVKVDSAV